MTTQQLTAEAMALPPDEKVALAQSLWKSIHNGLPEGDKREALREAIRRDGELSSDPTKGRTHEEVMRAARGAIGNV